MSVVKVPSWMISHDTPTGASSDLASYLNSYHFIAKSRDEIVALQDYAKTVLKKRITIVLAEGFEKWTAAKTDIDIDYISLVGASGKTIIDASGIPDVEGNYWVRFYCGQTFDIGNVPYVTGNFMYGIQVKGPGRSSNVIGRWFYSPEGQMGGCATQNVSILEFKTGDKYGTNAYCLDHYKSDISRCSVHVECSAANETVGGVAITNSNYGENVTYWGGKLHTSQGLAVANRSITFGLNLNDMSIDYVARGVVTAGRTIIRGGWHEVNNASSWVTDTFYYCENSEHAYLYMSNVNILAHNPALKAQFLVGAASDSGLGIVWEGCRSGGITTLSGRLDDGVVRFRSSRFNLPLYAGNHNTTIQLSSTNCVNADPLVESTTVADWYIKLGGGTLTSRTTSTNVNMAVDTTQDDENHRCVSVTKSSAQGTTTQIQALAAIGNANQVSYSLTLKSQSTGSVFINMYYAAVVGYDQFGVPIIGKLSQRISGERAVALNGTWQTTQSSPLRTLTPSWATHFIVEVALSALTSGSVVYLDNLRMGRM